MSDPHTWRRLCGKAVTLCGGQSRFQREARILQRLVRQFGAPEVEHMLDGAQRLGWHSLVSLGSKEGLGRRWALEAYWHAENRGPAPQSLSAIFRHFA